MSTSVRLFPSLFFIALVASPLQVFAHGGTTSTVPFEICESQELGDPCQWDDGHGSLHIGTCRGVAPSLRCVRNQPLVTVPSTEVHEAHGHTHGHTHGPTHAHPASSEEHSTNAVPLTAFALVMIAALGFAWKRFGRTGQPGRGVRSSG